MIEVCTLVKHSKRNYFKTFFWRRESILMSCLIFHETFDILLKKLSLFSYLATSTYNQIIKFIFPFIVNTWRKFDNSWCTYLFCWKVEYFSRNAPFYHHLDESKWQQLIPSILSKFPFINLRIINVVRHHLISRKIVLVSRFFTRI